MDKQANAEEEGPTDHRGDYQEPQSEKGKSAFHILEDLAGI